MSLLNRIQYNKHAKKLHLTQLTFAYSQEEEGKRNVSSINNAIFTAKMKNEADTMSYVQEQEASSNKLLHTEEYIRWHLALI